jgi:hypothetical protein
LEKLQNYTVSFQKNDPSPIITTYIKCMIKRIRNLLYNSPYNHKKIP